MELAPTALRRQSHLAFSASEVFVGVAVSDWPLLYAALIYRSPSFVIFVVQPVFQVITAELPSSFQVPVIPSPRVAFAAPSLDSVISNGCPAVSLTFHTPLKGACGKGGEARHGKKAGRRNGHHSCFPHVRTSLQETHVILFSKHRLRVRGPDLADRLRGTTNPHVVRTPQPPDAARRPASAGGRCRRPAAPRSVGE